MIICSVDKTVPKYFHRRVCNSERILDSKGFFSPLSPSVLAKFCSIQTRRMCCWRSWEWRMCKNVGRSDDRCGAVVGDSWA